jgi:MoaA/NifB/PqqE/SkfB family radical SAM enzyme
LKRDFDLGEYLSKGIERVIKNAIKATLKNPRETAFLTKYAHSAKKAAKQRRRSELAGEHIPSFLIAGITEECNLHCVGCYANANAQGGSNACMSRRDWSRVFSEAGALGIAMILLAGGEPLMRRDVIEEAASHVGILFPVFSNGTMMDGETIRLFHERRNLVPIISIEGDAELTDERRGGGVYAQTAKAMESLQNKGIPFGVSITVTSRNLSVVTSPEFCDTLRKTGCAVVIFVEYVPVERRDLALSTEQREYLQARLDTLRKHTDSMIFIAFPGDEKRSGGCLAAGRGFFHINAAGGAEPCPFSPHSDTNVKDVPLRRALQSPLFLSLKSDGMLTREHTGGCTLFEFDGAVAAILSSGETAQTNPHNSL